MSYKIKFRKDEFSEDELKKMKIRINGDDVIVSFFDKEAYLPIKILSENRFVLWGNKNNPRLRVPLGAFLAFENIKSGQISQLKPKIVDVIANAAQENGIWFQIKVGIKAILIKDIYGKEHAYILTMPATHYFKTMTRSEKMPVLIKQVI